MIVLNSKFLRQFPTIIKLLAYHIVMSSKQVSYAKHSIFFKLFFQRHKEISEKFILLNYSNLVSGYRSLGTFFSSYSYYLDDDDFLGQTIESQKTKFRSNTTYQELFTKSGGGENITKLSLSEIKSFDKIFFNNLKNIFELFEQCINKLSPTDIMPNVTSNTSEYEKSVLYASYDSFFEFLYLSHYNIGELLTSFNLLSFKDTLKNLMAFFYGYSFYLGRNAQNSIKIKFDQCWKKYQQEDTIYLITKLLNKKTSANDLIQIKNLNESLYKLLNEIFQLINADLPNQNIMPRKKERVLVDRTLI